MAREPDSLQWRIDAMTILHRVTAAERRLSASIRVNKITMLAAADELQAATMDATTWLTANPCPEARLRAQVAWVLTSCAEAALTAGERPVIRWPTRRKPSSGSEASWRPSTTTRVVSMSATGDTVRPDRLWSSREIREEAPRAWMWTVPGNH